MAAARVGSAPVVRLLLEAGADPKAVTAVRTTAVRPAAAVGEIETMRLLIAAGVDPKADAAERLVARTQGPDRPAPRLDRAWWQRGPHTVEGSRFENKQQSVFDDLR